jgi:hypothetical protein
MNPPGAPRPIVLERFVYRQGQTILARDFRDEQSVTDQDRWWHNRAVHNAYGLVWPLKPAEDPGIATAQFLRLCPFLGYDSFGREIILPHPKSIPFPALTTDGGSSTNWLLLAARGSERYADDGSGRAAIAPCSLELALPPKLWWVSEASWSVRAGIPVARIVPATQPGTFRLDTNYVPPGTRSLASPHIVSGATLPGNTAWQQDDKIRRILGNRIRSLSVYTVKIDTSAAGFNQVPCYQACLVGRRVGKATLPPPPSTSTTQDPPAQTATLLVVGGWIHGEQSHSLKYSILVQFPNTVDDSPQVQLAAFSDFASKAKLGVFWLGVEATCGTAPGWCCCGCPPDPGVTNAPNEQRPAGDT